MSVHTSEMQNLFKAWHFTELEKHVLLSLVQESDEHFGV